MNVTSAFWENLIPRTENVPVIMPNNELVVGDCFC